MGQFWKTKPSIRRQKDLGYHRDNYLNLIKFVKRMLQTNMKSEAEKSQLRVDIESTTELTEREWLLAQVEHLKKH